MQVITEVMDEGHIDMVAHYSDILQIGARNMQNFRLLEAPSGKRASRLD